MFTRFGNATSSVCPKGGYAWLTTKTGRMFAIETQCRTWRCNGCRERLKSRFKKRVIYGCSALEHTYLITVTYRLGPGSYPKTAAIVRKDWQAFQYQLRKKSRMNEELAWLKVPELTKKGMIHLHLIVGYPEKRLANCEDHPHKYDKAWRAACRSPDLECLEHEWSAAWHVVTGDSYVVDARPVLGPNGAAVYLAKYLVKSGDKREELEKLGFMRRHSTSKYWPNDSTLLLRGSIDGVWVKTKFEWKGEGTTATYQGRPNKRDPLLDRVGSELALALAEKASRKRLLSEVERKLQNANN